MKRLKILISSLVLALNTVVPLKAEVIYKNDYIPILMYHNILPSEEVTNNSSQVSIEMFKEQLMALKNAGYTSIDFNEYKLYKEGKYELHNKPFIITFDDGYLDNYTIAYPILKEMGLKATYFVSSQYVGVTTTTIPHFNWDNAKEMEASGLIDIQSHTLTHANMSLKTTNYKHEITESFKLIEENLGERDIKVLCYPQFLSNWQSRNTAKELGIDFQITTLATIHNNDYIPTQLHRIHTHNLMNGKQLLNEINRLTMH